MLKYLSSAYVTVYTEYLVSILAIAVIEAIPLMFIWNNVIVDAIAVTKTIPFTSAFLLVLMVRLLSRCWVKDTIKQGIIQQNLLTQSILNVMYNQLQMQLALLQPPPEGDLSAPELGKDSEEDSLK